MKKEQAIKTIKASYPNGGYEDLCKALDMAIQALQEQKVGKWIEEGYVGNDNYNFICSECGHTDTHTKAVKVNYCWFCGAKMEGAEK